MPGIIWLASYPKSGNTWVRAFLANYLQDAGEPLGINELTKHFYGDNVIKHYESITGHKLSDITPQNFPALRRRVHVWLAQSLGKDVFVKTHSALLRMNGAPLITPEVTKSAIYVVRNPLDVAVSAAFHFQLSMDQMVEALCNPRYQLPATEIFLPQVLTDWSSHVRSWTAARGILHHTLRYEDLARTPQKAFAGLIGFLRMPADALRISKAIEFSAFDRLRAQEEKTTFVEFRRNKSSKFFREGKIGAWQDRLTEAQVRRLVDAHGETMQQMGYLTPGGKLAI